MRRVGLVVAVAVIACGVGLLVLRGRCDDGREAKESVEFPYAVRIAPQNMLFVDGHEFHGEVVFSWEPGDSLRIEGIPVLPRRPLPEALRQPELSEEFLRRRYRRVPFVMERVEQGRTWGEAVSEYRPVKSAICREIDETYWRLVESTGSHDAAALALLDSLDRGIVDLLVDPQVFSWGMNVLLKGDSAMVSVAFGDEPPWERPTLEDIQRVTYEKASDFTRGMARNLSDITVTCLVVAPGRTDFGRGVVNRALKQIEEAEKGNMVEGPLPERELMLILMVRGVNSEEIGD